MTLTIDLVLLLIAAVCFAVAAFGPGISSRVNLTAAGLFCWVLTAIV
jgi:hypothetical protein